jgi:DNA-binding PadR family transcriptional regulator
LKYALLDLLKERPKHGYEMIKELEERAGGFYTPSAGSVYPTLQLLEDREWVSSETQAGKKVYTITDAGRKELDEHSQRQEQWRAARGEHHHGHHHEGPFGGRGPRPELHALRREAMEVAGLMRTAVMASGGDPARLEKVRAIVARTRADLLALLNEQPQSGQPGSSAPSDQPPSNML